MELWIRSQKNNAVDINQSLIKIDKIYLDYCGENDSYFISVNEGIEVAYYNTEKRALEALEVLDEIQKILNPMIIFNNCKCTQDVIESIKETGACFVTNDAHIEQVSTCVYEMPEE